ncbi:hypothetical protein ACN27E_05625 [Mycobacterium sp. WMMD1722]|uniref:hypothetical protein n=1 Tax=Mycobacterium sp. WMMD1722 TaxID=3404117 RepID=UPI003BF553FE
MTPSATGVDGVAQYTYRWISNPNLDLMTPEGTFVRAVRESIDRASFGEGLGISAIEDAAYPGFMRAFNNVIDPEVVGGNARKDLPRLGTLYYEVVRFQRDGEQYTVGLCTYGSRLATRTWDGYTTPGARSPSNSALIFSFGPNASLAPDQQIAPLEMQRGPENAPVDDVFGTWIMTSIKILGANVDLPECAGKLAPGTPQGLPDDYFVSPEPPPVLPPVPGWPDADNG